MGVRVGMKWFRSNIKRGSQLALLALAIQFALSFGHFHPIAVRAAPALQSSLYQFVMSRALGVTAPDTTNQSAQRQQPTSDHDSDGHSNDPCAICAVIAMANAVLFATPPPLRLPEAIEFLYRTIDFRLVYPNSVRVAFQPRAPPPIS